METVSYSERVRAILIVLMLVLSPLFLVVAYAPGATAAVTTGVTADMVPSTSRYIRDDSTAVAIWGFGATSNVGTDQLLRVEVWFDTSGTGLSPSSEMEPLNNWAGSSGVGIYRDSSFAGANNDVLDSGDTPLQAASCQWIYSAPDYYCRITFGPWPWNTEYVPAAVQGNYHWFIVIRTDWDIDDSDVVRTWIDDSGIRFTGASQPASTITGSTLNVVESDWSFVGAGGMERNDADAALGLRICDGGSYDTFDYIRMRFQNGGGFSQGDLAGITTTAASSGVALYRNDGDSSWDAGDTALNLASVSISWPNVYLYPNNEGVPDRPSGPYQYWIVIRTSGSISEGDSFTIYGETNAIRLDGATANDQNDMTPESGHSDSGYYVADWTNPYASFYTWSEGSQYLRYSGGVLWFSNLMPSSQSATLRCYCGDSHSGVDYVYFSAEPSLGAGASSDSSDPYQRTFYIDSTDTAADSPASMTVYDNVGRTAGLTATYAQDNTRPLLTITNPPNLDTLSGIAQITATVSDAQSGVRSNSVQVSWDLGSIWYQMIWDGSQWTYNWDTTLMADGEYRVLVRAYDNVNNEATSYVNVRIDNTGPMSAIVSPTPGQYVHSAQNLNVYAFASDKSGISSMEARLGAGAWTAMTFDAIYGGYTVDLGVPGAGNLNIQVRAYDTEGNLGPVATVIAIGDANDPTVAVTSHASGDEVAGTVTIQVQAADTERLAGVKVFVSGASSLTLDAVLNPITGLYEVTIDTTALSDGSWSIVAAAFDEAGRYATTAAFSITVDNTEPTLAIVQPADGAYIYGTYTVTASASDTGSGFDNGGCAISIDGGAWVIMPAGGGGQYTYGLDTTSLTDGGHTIVVAAVDDAGNLAVRTVRVFVDNTAPVVAVMAPSNGDYVEGSYTFAVSAVDNMGIANVSAVIALGGVIVHDVALGYNAASGYYEWTADTTGWADGDYDMKPYATELTGRAFTAASAISFYVDNNAPALTVNSPSDGEVILTSSHTVTITASDSPFTLLASQVRYRVDAGPWTQMTAGAGDTWSHVWDTTGVVDGTHALEFRVTDAAGHVSTDRVTVTVDNTDPTCMVAVPTAGQFLEGVVTFAVQATDGLGVESVDITFMGIQGYGTVATTFNPSTGYWEYVLDTTTLTDTDASLTALATDASGRTTTAAQVGFRIDNNAPTLVIDAPMDGEIVLNATYDVTVQADDATFGLTAGDVRWRVDSNPWADMQTGATGWTVNWFTSDYADGEHTLHFRATDAAGHVTQEAITVTVDNNDPTVALNTPSVGEYVGGVYTFAARATDSLGVATVEMHFGFSGPAPLSDAQATYDPSSGYWELTVDTATLPDGPASLVLVATDTSGRQTTSATHDFAVDNHAPELQLVSPLPGDIVLDGTVEVEVMASDMGFDLGLGDVEYSLDGTGWMDMVNLTGEPTLWGFDLTTTTLLDGEHELAFRVTDGAGHVTAASVTFLVDNHDPVCSIVSPAQGEFAMGVYHFRVAASDALGIEGVELSFTGIATLTGASATYNPASGMWEFLIDTSTLDDTSAAISAVATDTSGRTSFEAGPVNFTIDNNAPVVAFVSPVEGQIITEGAHTITVSAVDRFFDVEYGAVQLSIDGGGWGVLDTGDEGEFVYEWNTSAVTDGYHNLQARAEDRAGHSMEASINVIIDNHVPALAIVAPTEGQYATGGLTFQVAASDARGIVEVTIDWGDGPVATTINAATNYYEFSLDTTTLVDGTYELTATATDGSGLVSTALVTFNVDNHEPELTFDGPLTGEILAGEVTVRASAQDAFVDSLQFSVDGVGWVDMVDGEGTFDSTRFSDGEHTITVRAIDGSGKETTASSIVTIDNTAPLFTAADFPAMNEHFAGEMLFALFASDAVGVESVTAAIGDDSWPVYINPATGFYEWTFDSTGYNDGFYDLLFTASDAAGHESTVSWTVFVDNTAPVVIDQFPRDKSTVEGKVVFRTIATDDSGIDSVLLRIGQENWVAMTLQDDGSYVYRWETTSDDDEEDLQYTIRVRDTLGNVEDETHTFTVDNPASLAYIALLIILVVLIVFVYILMRRRAEGEEAESEPDQIEEELEEITAPAEGLDELLNPQRPPQDTEAIAEEIQVELEEKSM